MHFFHPVFALLLVLLSSGSGVNAAAAAFLSPLGYNASLGSTAMFHCRVVEAAFLAWEVDGLQNTFTSIRDRGVRSTPIVTIDANLGIKESNLTVPASVENNGSLVACYSITAAGPKFGSNLSTLLVQGLLDAPRNAVLQTTIDGHSKVLTWSPPFTLDITGQEPDIITYSVYTHCACEHPINTTDLQFVMPGENVQRVYVSAWNAVGEGKKVLVQYQEQDTYTIELSTDEYNVSPCFTCYFKHGSESRTQGCHIAVYSTVSPQVVISSVDLLREGNVSSESCVNQLVEGQYIIWAYDIDSNGDIKSDRGGTLSSFFILHKKTHIDACNESTSDSMGSNQLPIASTEIVPTTHLPCTLSTAFLAGAVAVVIFLAAIATALFVLWSITFANFLQAKKLLSKQRQGLAAIDLATNDAYMHLGDCDTANDQDPHYAEIAN